MNRQHHPIQCIRAFIILFAIWSALSAPLIASAHDGEAHIELNTAQAQSGTAVEVHGTGFDPGDAITFVLLGADHQRSLGAVNADDEGSFTWTLALPEDLLPGAYEVRAADSHHGASAPLTITPAISSEENEQRDESEPLLSAMPTHRSSAASAPSTAVAAPLTAAAGGISAAWLLLPVGTLAVVGMALALRRRSVR